MTNKKPVAKYRVICRGEIVARSNKLEISLAHGRDASLRSSGAPAFVETDDEDVATFVRGVRL